MSEKPYLDLADVLKRRGPKKRAVIDLATFDIGSLGLGELLDVAEAAGVAPDDLGGLLSSGTTISKARAMLAIGWVATRSQRGNAGLTFDEFKAWDFEVVNGTVNPPKPAPRRRGSGSSSKSGG